MAGMMLPPPAGSKKKGGAETEAGGRQPAGAFKKERTALAMEK